MDLTKTAPKRAERRELQNVLNNFGNPKGMGRSRRNKKGEIIRDAARGCGGGKQLRPITKYTECEKGLTPADLRRKAEQISRASKTRKAPTTKRAKKAVESLS
jgi:hypothetical protein